MPRISCCTGRCPPQRRTETDPAPRRTRNDPNLSASSLPGATDLNTLEFSALVAAVSAVAGFLGALTGLGGGVVITPVLTILLGVDLRYAIGATLVSVIATSSGAAAAYVREGYSNIRVGMFLEIATTIGAVAGAAVATRTPNSPLAIIFGVILLYSAWDSIRRKSDKPAPKGC